MPDGFPPSENHRHGRIPTAASLPAFHLNGFEWRIYHRHVAGSGGKIIISSIHSRSFTPDAMQKPRLNFWQIWNMSFGFLGIQFGWGLQMANMSAIYRYLGANADSSSPFCGWPRRSPASSSSRLVGQSSDRIWTRLGRRRPFILGGAILASLALVLMPNCSVGLDGGGAALGAGRNHQCLACSRSARWWRTILPEEQNSQGFAIQSLFIGLGGTVASALPWMMTNWFGVDSDARRQRTHSAFRPAFVLHRRGGVHGRGAVDGFQHVGISAVGKRS